MKLRRRLVATLLALAALGPLATASIPGPAADRLAPPPATAPYVDELAAQVTLGYDEPAAFTPRPRPLQSHTALPSPPASLDNEPLGTAQLRHAYALERAEVLRAGAVQACAAGLETCVGYLYVARYKYDAWGLFRDDDQGFAFGPGSVSNQQLVNRSTYTGKYYDREANLFYFNARYYDPDTGRFISQDGFDYGDTSNPPSLHLYYYAMANPLRYVDPDGHQSADINDYDATRSSLGPPALAPGAQGNGEGQPQSAPVQPGEGAKAQVVQETEPGLFPGGVLRALWNRWFAGFFDSTGKLSERIDKATLDKQRPTEMEDVNASGTQQRPELQAIKDVSELSQVAGVEGLKMAATLIDDVGATKGVGGIAKELGEAALRKSGKKLVTGHVDEALGAASEKDIGGYVAKRESMSAEARVYQDAVAGAPEGTVYRVPYENPNPRGRPHVDFDTRVGDLPVDAKLAIVTKAKTVNQAVRQAESLRQHDARGVWKVPSLKEAYRARRILEKANAQDTIYIVVERGIGGP